MTDGIKGAVDQVSSHILIHFSGAETRTSSRQKRGEISAYLVCSVNIRKQLPVETFPQPYI